MIPILFSHLSKSVCQPCLIWFPFLFLIEQRNCWVQDLFIDLRTGYLLVRLLEILTDEVLGLEYIESRLHWIQNVQRVLNYLRYRGVSILLHFHALTLSCIPCLRESSISSEYFSNQQPGFQLQIRIVNIRADEIVDGNPKLTLGLIWIIILHFQVSRLHLEFQHWLPFASI
ncbi:hypothetical protein EG68_05798 [Paragonimus skrjabini miyazakii]|uniref:Calponin-homology (CH) domain-containing protein n=1 Tax=Paragonimus skrjabini miyazakii TaxID=59628 RepID=A0A8S9YVR0_9TREM|nr:hypothetical protein EG68_05798 [Paragonimus skrjabini miyazakii]